MGLLMSKNIKTGTYKTVQNLCVVHSFLISNIISIFNIFQHIVIINFILKNNYYKLFQKGLKLMWTNSISPSQTNY